MAEEKEKLTKSKSTTKSTAVSIIYPPAQTDLYINDAVDELLADDMQKLKNKDIDKYASTYNPASTPMYYSSASSAVGTYSHGHKFLYGGGGGKKSKLLNWKKYINKSNENDDNKDDKKENMEFKLKCDDLKKEYKWISFNEEGDKLQIKELKINEIPSEHELVISIHSSSLNLNGYSCGSGLVIRTGRSCKYKPIDIVAWYDMPDAVGTHLCIKDNHPNLFKVSSELQNIYDSDTHHILSSLLKDALEFHVISNTIIPFNGIKWILVLNPRKNKLFIHLSKRFKDLCIIAAVKNKNDKEMVKKLGVHHIFVNEKNVMEITNDRGVDLIYGWSESKDCEEALKCAKIRGICIFQDDIKKLNEMHIKLINDKSLMVTIPKLQHFMQSTQERETRINDAMKYLSDFVPFETEIYSLNEVPIYYRKLKNKEISHRAVVSKFIS